MTQPDYAVFLGAGASCSEGAPSQANLLKEFFLESFERYRDCHPGHPTLQRIRVLKQRLTKFFLTFFGFDPTTNPAEHFYPTFEEVLGIIDLALNREESFRGFEDNLRSDQAGVLLRNVRNDFVFLIALILDKKLEGRKTNHRHLIDNLSYSKALNKFAFVSFNYDILIDNALADVHTDYSLDYGIDVEYEEEAPINSALPSVPLFKLHGSLGWLHCPTCRTVSVTFYKKIAIDALIEPVTTQCYRCGCMRIPVVIPPTYFKVLSNVFIQQVWHKAEATLKNCRTWVFCGYSFPDADMHVKYKLKRVQVNSQPPRIIVVNSHKEKDSRLAEDEINRIQRFFGSGVRVIDTMRPFEAFASDPLKFVAEPE